MTKYKHIPTNKVLTIGQSFLDENGRRHTDKWAGWSEEMKASCGIVVVPEALKAEGDPPSFNRNTQTVSDIGGEWVVSDIDFELAHTLCTSALDSLEDFYAKEARIDVGGLVIPVAGKTLDKLSMGKRKPKASRKLRIGDQIATVSAAMVDLIDDAIIAYHDAVDTNAATLQEALNAAETISDLTAVDLSSGWPDVVGGAIES